MTRNNQVKQNSRKVDYMLNWVHSKPGPRANVDVFVMYIMDRLVEWFPVEQTMSEVKMRIMDNRNNKQKEDKIYCVFHNDKV